MPIILERRHRLLHMRAPLERNCGQSKFHCVHTGPSVNSRIRNQIRKTSWPQVWENSRKENIIWSIIWKRDASRSSQGSMIVSCEIMLSANGCSKTIEMMFVVNGTILQKKITPFECQNQNIFITDKTGGSLSVKSRDTGGPLRDRSDFNQALSKLNRLHRESGKQQLRSMPYWKCSRNGTLHRVLLPPGGNGANPGGLPENSKKNNKRGLRSNGATCGSQIFGENLRRMAFTNSFYFVTDRSFTADGGLL